MKYKHLRIILRSPVHMLSKRVVILATTVTWKASFPLPLVVESYYNHIPSNSEYMSASRQQDQNLSWS